MVTHALYIDEYYPASPEPTVTEDYYDDDDIGSVKYDRTSKRTKIEYFVYLY